MSKQHHSEVMPQHCHENGSTLSSCHDWCQRHYLHCHGLALSLYGDDFRLDLSLDGRPFVSVSSLLHHFGATRIILTSCFVCDSSFGFFIHEQDTRIEKAGMNTKPPAFVPWGCIINMTVQFLMRHNWCDRLGNNSTIDFFSERPISPLLMLHG